MKAITRGCLEERAEKMKLFLLFLQVRRAAERADTPPGSSWRNIPTLLHNTFHYVMPLGGKEKNRRLPRVHLVLMVVLMGLCSLLFIGQHVAWAAGTHMAYPSSATLQHSVSTSSLTKTSLASSMKHAANPNAIIINGHWFCPPPFIPQAQAKVILAPGAIDDGDEPDGDIDDLPTNQYQEMCVKEGALFFPCSDVPNVRNGSMQPVENVIAQDWLSGNVPIAGTGNTVVQGGGHIVYTYDNETYGFPEVTTLFGYMQGLGFLLITPSILLLGYQIMLGASSFRYAGALEGLSRVLLGGVAVAACFELVQMLISFEDTAGAAILTLHSQHPFPLITVNGAPVPYRLFNATRPGEPITSFRGIAVPMSRWGCAFNDFVGILSVPFVATTLASVIPMLSGFTHLAGTVMSIPDLIHRIGEMVLTLLSIVLWIQVFLRIVLLNYYILTGPLAFGCWALPGGVGQNVVRLWCKGFFSVLFVQVLQLFILTTLPLLLPTLPQIPSDSVGLIQGFLLEFPPILTLCVALMAPRLLGTSAARAFGTAGSMAGGVVTAVGTAVSHLA